MPKSLDTLKTEWRQARGAIHVFHQAAVVQNDGVCMAACKYVIRERARGKPATVIYDDLLDPAIWQSVIDAQAGLYTAYDAHGGKVASGYYKVGTDAPVSQTRRTFTGSKHLNSRAKITAALLGTRGLYILGVRNHWNKMGHALAFDTTLPDLVFFDANEGFFVMEGVRIAQDGFFTTWFSDYYATMYKADRKWGRRVLSRYEPTVNPWEPPAVDQMALDDLYL